MTLNNSFKRFSVLATRAAKVFLTLVAIALMLQNVPFLNSTALAAPATFIAASAGDQIKGAADDVRSRSKDIIRDSQKNVKKTANKNASKVDQADDEGTAVERKALRDRSRIEKRANEDASRTEKAVDKSMDSVKGLVDKVKDAFD